MGHFLIVQPQGGVHGNKESINNRFSGTVHMMLEYSGLYWSCLPITGLALKHKCQ